MLHMKPTLKFQPSDYALRDLLVKYSHGAPISCDQYNFLYRHEKALTNHMVTDLKRYYLKDYYLKHAAEHTFLMPHDKLDAAATKELKRRIELLVDSKNAIQFKMKPEQFLQMRAMTTNELILYHGNQFLTGAPFYQGGVPHTLYFQWGNLFGVAKYVVIADEKALKSNVLIYFENMHERYLDQCVMEYQHKFENKFDPAPLPKVAPVQTTAPAYQSKFGIPTLSLSRNKEKQDKA
jgi:hypothetical protein